MIVNSANSVVLILICCVVVCAATGEEDAWIVVDISQQYIIDQQNAALLEEPQMVGSLLKPLLAYAGLVRGHADAVHYCRASGVDEAATLSCWYRPGHGNLRLRGALAESCNAWFRAWLDAADAKALLDQLSALSPALVARATEAEHPLLALAGLEDDLMVHPLEAAAAFASLFRGQLVRLRQGSRGLYTGSGPSLDIQIAARRQISAGMRETTAAGTAGRLPTREQLLVKTGTAYSVRDAVVNRAQTTGWCIIIAPMEGHTILVLARAAGTGAADAAPLAYRLLQQALELMP